MLSDTEACPCPCPPASQGCVSPLHLCPLTFCHSPTLHLPQDFLPSDSWARVGHCFAGPAFPGTIYSDPSETIWRPNCQPQKSPQMSCPMTRAAVTGVCRLRDMVSHGNLIIAQEWRMVEGGAGSPFKGTYRKPSSLQLGGYLPGLIRPGITGEQA